MAEPPAPPTLVKRLYLFEIQAEEVARVKEAALTRLKRPLLTEYDFRRDNKNASLSIALKTATKIRYYQVRKTDRQMCVWVVL